MAMSEKEKAKLLEAVQVAINNSREIEELKVRIAVYKRREKGTDANAFSCTTCRKASRTCGKVSCKFLNKTGGHLLGRKRRQAEQKGLMLTLFTGI